MHSPSQCSLCISCVIISFPSNEETGRKQVNVKIRIRIHAGHLRYKLWWGGQLGSWMFPRDVFVLLSCWSGKLCHRIKWNSITSPPQVQIPDTSYNQNAPCSGGQWLAQRWSCDPNVGGLMVLSWGFGSWSLKRWFFPFYLRTTQLRVQTQPWFQPK